MSIERSKRNNSVETVQLVLDGLHSALRVREFLAYGHRIPMRYSLRVDASLWPRLIRAPHLSQLLLARG
jgi:hypothetical protein